MAVGLTPIGITEVARPVRDPIMHFFGVWNIVMGLAFAVFAIVSRRRVGRSDPTAARAPRG